MRNIFRDLLDISMVIYLDDILIFSKNLEEHIKIIWEVLRGLQEYGLYVKESKCHLNRQSVEFLGMIVLANGLQMYQDNIQTIQDWPIPNSIKEVQAFLRFANFYHRFICDYAKVAMPLIALMLKNQHFVWTTKACLALKNLKSKFIQAPV